MARGLRWAAYALVPALLLLLLGLPQTWAWFALLLIPLAATSAALWPLDVMHIARFADQSAQINGAAETAFHLAETQHPAAAAVALDAVDALKGKAPPPLAWPAYWRALALVAMLLGVGIGARLWWSAQPAPEDLSEENPDDPLAAAEDRARRAGDEDLIEAVANLREQLRQVQAPEEMRRHSASKPKAVPLPPPVSELPPPPAQLPADMETPEEYRDAVDLAVQAMASDDALLASIAEEIFQELQSISFGGDVGVNFLEEAMMDQDLNAMSAMQIQASEGGRQINDDPTASFTPFGMQNESLNNELIESTGAPQIEMDPNLVQGDDMASESHQTKANLMQSYRDFMKEYSEALRDELLKAIQESTDPDAWEKVEEGEEQEGEGKKPSGQGGPNPEGEGEMRSELRKSNAEAPEGTQAMNAPSDATGGKPTGRGKASTGGDAGGGRSVGPGSSAQGSTTQVQGKLTPGNLEGEQREAVLDGVASRSVETGAGDQFDDAWGGYFEEVDRTLEEEDLPPQMQGMVRAYFAGLQESE
jgi:hypothetical protein